MTCPPCPHCQGRFTTVRELDLHLRFRCPVLRRVELDGFGIAPVENGRSAS